jgi:hypothetical protein
MKFKYLAVFLPNSMFCGTIVPQNNIIWNPDNFIYFQKKGAGFLYPFAPQAIAHLQILLSWIVISDNS